MKRHGQITIFVAIGLVILLIVGLYLLIPHVSKPTTMVAQQDAQLITATVQQCLQQVGEQSVRAIGLTGGYATLSTLKDVPTRDTQVVTIAPQKIALWHEVQTPKNAPPHIEDHRPPLCAQKESCPVPDAIGSNSIQESIQLLIEQNIDSCLNNFSGTPQIIVETRGRPEAHAQIRENDIALKLQYPLQLTTEDNQQVDLDEYSATLQVQLPQTYRLARRIQSLERNQAFMEEVFLNLLTVYSGVDTPLPPIREIKVNGGKHTWQRSEVQKTTEEQVLPFMNFLQVTNAQESYVPIVSPNTDPEYQDNADGIYEYMAITLDNTTSYPLGVRFEYPNTPIGLDINGQEYLKPRSVPGTWVLKILGISIEDYRFKYTVNFPMVVHVTDPAAFNGRGYDFDFAMEANIKNNHALNVSAQADLIDFGQSSVDLNDESQLVNHTFKVQAKDRRTKMPLAGAQVGYACGSEYLLGETDENGTWTGKAPFCLAGGYFMAGAEGYVRTGAVQDNTEDDGLASPLLTIELWPVQQKTITVYKRTAADVAAYTGSGVALKHNLTKYDALTLQIQRMKEAEFESDVPEMPALQFGGSTPQDILRNNVNDMKTQLDVMYRAGQISDQEYSETLSSISDVAFDAADSPDIIMRSANVGLVPGKYELEGYLMYNNLIQIPPKYDDNKQPSQILIEAQNFTSWQSGGIILFGDDAIDLTPDMIYGDKNLTIYVLEQPIPATWDDVMGHQELADYQTYDRRQLAKPTFD